MLLALMLSLAVQGSNPPVTVQINHDQFSSGDHARVHVQTAQDGYLVVLHADPDGRIRVLFPLDPSDDDFIRGGRRFELRGRNDRDAFQIDREEGSGTVLAAVSADPFKFDDFVRNDHWDFRALGGASTAVRDDPLANLLDIVRRMSGDSSGHFEYDQATYVVRSSRLASRYGYDGYGYGYGYDYPYGFRFGLTFGYPFYNPFFNPYCDPFWGCYGGFGYPYGYGYGFFYRPYIYRFRPFVFDNFGRRFATTRTLVMPQNRDRVVAIPVRPRSRVSEPVPIRNRGMGSPAPRIAPRPSSSPRSRPSISRGWSGGSSRPAARPSNGGGGRRH